MRYPVDVSNFPLSFDEVLLYNFYAQTILTCLFNFTKLTKEQKKKKSKQKIAGVLILME